MVLNEGYTLFFENKGKCPECGYWLIPHIGCIQWLTSQFKTKKLCRVKASSSKMYIEVHKESIDYRLYLLRKALSYKHGKRNLDIQPKKTYFEAND